ncbi:MAG: hypothetical protein LBE34_16350 [Flavobacteriaceae bacterium]|jgi:hypothetical protein|nr:hypothetical protein [Flavobacteriaceae bacterium]
MENKKTGISRYINLLITVITLLSFQVFYAQFPYFNSAQSGADFLLLGESKAGLVTYSVNGIKLVDNTNQYSGVSLESLNFSTSKGFILEFEYAMDKGAQYDGKYGDGIAMVLYDGTVTKPRMGDKGGALGYAYTKKTSTSSIKGFEKGFLGLGLDLYGNYKNTMANTDEVRNGIMSNNEGDFIVLRGPNSLIDYEGYPILFAVGTINNTNYYLDRVTGAPIKKQKGLEGQRFSLRGNKIDAKVGDPEYRKAIISLIPGIDETSANSESGFFISIDMINGVYRSSIIKNYFIPRSGNIKYTEQMTTSSSSVKTLKIETPSSLKMAFTGSTGGAAIQAHIRNIALSLPFSPIANDMVLRDVVRSRQSVIKPLYSAFGYSTNLYSIINPPNKSMMYLDKESFRFMILGTNNKFVENADPYNYKVDGVGEFKYNKSTGEVIFIPVTTSTDKTVTFYYDIKNLKPAGGSDISTEEYRSRIASVTLYLTDSGTVFSDPVIIINKGVKNTKKP